MLFEQRPADADHMHDRKHAGPFEVSLFRRAIVRKQASHCRITAEAGRRQGRNQAVDPAVVEMLRKRLARWKRPQLDFRRQCQGDPRLAAGLLQPAAAPLHIGGAHPVFVLQDAAYPHRCGHRVFRHADHLATQIIRTLDAAVAADVYRRMAKQT
jgi:hypothetical protein